MKAPLSVQKVGKKYACMWAHFFSEIMYCTFSQDRSMHVGVSERSVFFAVNVMSSVGRPGRGSMDELP